MWFNDLDELGRKERRIDDMDEELFDDEISIRESAFVRGYIEDYKDKPEAEISDDDEW